MQSIGGPAWLWARGTDVGDNDTGAVSEGDAFRDALDPVALLGSEDGTSAGQQAHVIAVEELED